MAVDNTYGVSGTSLTALPQGALKALGGAKNVAAAEQIARSLIPQREPVDPARPVLDPMSSICPLYAPGWPQNPQSLDPLDPPCQCVLDSTGTSTHWLAGRGYPRSAAALRAQSSRLTGGR